MCLRTRVEKSGWFRRHSRHYSPHIKTFLRPARSPHGHFSTRLLSAPLSNSNETLARIHEIVVLYVSIFSVARSSANLQWYLINSSPIPPVVLETRRVKVPCSTSMTLITYFRLFCCSCCLYSSLEVRSF